MSIVIEMADILERQIETFLKKHENGGRFILPGVEGSELAIPLMILTFEEQGWDVEYDFNEEAEWLEFKKPTVQLLTFNGNEDGE